MNTTRKMTRDQREAYLEEAAEDRRLMREFKQAFFRMGVEQKTAVLLFVRELACPGSVYRAVYDDPAKVLRLK